MWWPQIDNDIEALSRSCQSCKSAKQGPPKAPLQPWIWPSKSWTRLHIDIAGPFKGSNFLSLVDAHSKCPEVHRMSTYQTIKILRSLFARYGISDQVVSDNGPQFISSEFGEFMKNKGIKHFRCSPYHPSSNGQAERFVRSFKEDMIACENK